MTYNTDINIEEHITSLVDILHKDASGISFKAIYEQMKSIDDEAELAKIIHEALDRKLCFKIVGRYYPKGAVTIQPSSVDKAITEEIKQLLPTERYEPPIFIPAGETRKIVKSTVSRTKIDKPIEPIQSTAPNGGLSPKCTIGKLAYAIWCCTGYVVDRSDAWAIVGKHTNINTVYRAISYLKRIGMVNGVDNPNSKHKDLTWSGNYNYPFKTVSSRDRYIIPFSNFPEYKTWKMKEHNEVIRPNIISNDVPKEDVIPISPIHLVPNIVKPKTEHNSISEHSTTFADLIDMRIKFHEAELFFLNKLKQNMDK